MKKFTNAVIYKHGDANEILVDKGRIFIQAKASRI